VRTAVPKNILLIDKDEAFGTVMLEAIQESGDFEVRLFTSATAALTTLKQKPFDLVIVDQGVDDLPLPHVIRGARMLRANIPVLIMPYDGSEIPRELAPLGLQGALSKIFFRMDLPQKIEVALGIAASGAPALPGGILPPVAAPASAPPAAGRARTAQGGAVPPRAQPAPPPTLPPAPPPGGGESGEEGSRAARPKLELKSRVAEEINYHLRALVRELGADAALFVYGGELVASAGTIQRARVVELAAALDATWTAMHRLGNLAGDPDGIVQAFIEGKEHIAYTMRIGTQGAIAVVTPAGTSPGSIRLRAREAANSIEMLVS
jgi:predicted regulator of Ras-like GTPase activity (Roadblock/LC7/MglB family)